MIWKRLNGHKVGSLLDEVKAEIDRYDSPTVVIGTDSQAFGESHDFTTAVVVIRPRKGGAIFYKTSSEKKKFSLREKLFREAWMSVETALLLAPIISEDVQVSIHVDVNPNTRFASSKYFSGIVGLVTGQNYAVTSKPYAWAASHIAEHIVKKKHERDISV